MRVLEVSQHSLPRVADGVMRFVRYHQAEVVWRPIVQTPDHALHAGDYDAVGGPRGKFGLLFAGDNSGCRVQLGNGLVNEFFAMRQDERLIRALLGQMGKDDGLTSTGRDHNELALKLSPTALNTVDDIMLVWAQVHQCRV
mgnify:CR=1 FL=1